MLASGSRTASVCGWGVARGDPSEVFTRISVPGARLNGPQEPLHQHVVLA